MFFKRKIKRVLNLEEIEERHEKEIKEELEKGDLFAMIIAALIVFTPVILLLIGIVYFLLWLFTH
jgi:cell division septal protein FtsQ